jgi:mRNA interferase RelE/StbE
MSYQVILPKSVQKELNRLPIDMAGRILEALSDLKEQPRPPGCKKLRGESAWRIRIGNYRVIYEIHDKVLQIIIVTVGHRREVYR